MAEQSVADPDARAADVEPTSVFLRACRGLPVERTPVWLLRQAGRYQPAYRAIREKHSMLEVIRTPELAAQVTLLPIDSFGLDAAIVFSDILPPLVGMGLDLDFVKGDGPRIGNPISTRARRRHARHAAGGGDDDGHARGDPHRPRASSSRATCR